MDDTFKKKAVWGSLSILYCAVLYGSGHFSPLTARYFERAWIDHVTPFVPATILIYLSLYVFIVWTVLKLPWETTRQFLIAIFISQTTCFLFFIFYPVAYPRHEFIQMLNPMAVSDGIVGFVWKYLDKPTNCFPSLHVAAASLCAIYWFKHKRILWPWLVAGVIFVSTLTMKQHYFYDIVGGLALAFINAHLAGRVDWKFMRTKPAIATRAAENPY